MNRSKRLSQDLAALKELIADGGHKDRVKDAWYERTRRKQASFYHRLDEVSVQERQRFDDLPDGRTHRRDAYEALSDGIDVVKVEARKKGREATKEDLRRFWEGCGYGELLFRSYWEALPRSERQKLDRTSK